MQNDATKKTLSYWKDFFNKNLKKKLKELDSLVENQSAFNRLIADLINKEKIEDAKLSLEEFLVDHSDNVLGISNYIDCLGKLSNFEEAENFIQGLEDKIKMIHSICHQIKYEQILLSKFYYTLSCKVKSTIVLPFL